MRNVLLLMLVGFSLTACGQGSAGVKKAHAFYRHSLPGNIPVDDSGTPLTRNDTVRFIYLECSGNAQPVITSVEYGGSVFSASVFAVEKLPVLVGEMKNSKRDISIRPAKGNKLWLAELTPAGERVSNSKKIVMKGMLNKKRFAITVKNEVELESEIKG